MCGYSPLEIGLFREFFSGSGEIPKIFLTHKHVGYVPVISGPDLQFGSDTIVAALDGGTFRRLHDTKRYTIEA